MLRRASGDKYSVARRLSVGLNGPTTSLTYIITAHKKHTHHVYSESSRGIYEYYTPVVITKMQRLDRSANHTVSSNGFGEPYSSGISSAAVRKLVAILLLETPKLIAVRRWLITVSVSPSDDPRIDISTDLMHSKNSFIVCRRKAGSVRRCRATTEA